MTTVLLIRHGRTKANADGVLAGWTPGVLLDDAGEGQARQLAERLMPVPLAKDPMWKVVQSHPSAAVFPGAEGESMAHMQHRAVTSIREWNARLGPDAVYAVVSHGDVIKAILADALGMHLDQFQRIRVDPCSVSIVDYTALRPFVGPTNDTGGSLAGLAPKPARKGRRRASSDAVVGGGAGA